ncbi:MAG: hypothetical protein R6U65_03610 [Perlabentimonas sp.]
MAFVEFGMTEDEFFHEPPYKFLVRQLNYQRERERQWEQTRLMVATMYNASGRAKRRVKPQDIITLDIDHKSRRIEYDQELIEKIMKAWKPIKA